MKKLLIFGATLLLPMLTYAQIVMIEGKRLSEDSLGWHGAITVDLYNTKNTERIYTVGAGSVVQFRKGNHRVISLNNLRIIQNVDDESPAQENRGHQHFRYNYILNDTWVLESFVQAQFDEVLRIGFRGLAGGGARLKLIHKEKDQLNLGLSGMFEYEEEKDTTVVHRDFRLTTYLSYEKEFSEHFTVSLISYYQPRADEFTDYRISSGLNFNLQFNERFGFNISASLVYDAQPVIDEDITKLTYSITNGISYRF